MSSRVRSGPRSAPRLGSLASWVSETATLRTKQISIGDIEPPRQLRPRFVDGLGREGHRLDGLDHNALRFVSRNRGDTVRIRCAALLRVDGITAKIETTATDWVKGRLDQFRVQILNTVGATRDAYTRVQEQTTVPEAVTVQLRQNERAATKDAKGDDLPRYQGHVFADADGTFPVVLNDWSARSSRQNSPGMGSRRGIGTRGAPRRPRSGSPTRMTRMCGRRSNPTSSSCRDARMGPSARRSSTLTATILPMHGRRYGLSRRSPSTLATGSYASSR